MVKNNNNKKMMENEKSSKKIGIEEATKSKYCGGKMKYKMLTLRHKHSDFRDLSRQLSTRIILSYDGNYISLFIRIKGLMRILTAG